MTAVQVLTVDDQPVFREAVRALIFSTPGIETARILTAKRSDTVVVLLSGHEVDDVTGLADQCGAVALVAKERLRPALLRELWATHRPHSTAVQPES
jgi:DNA-binding NarL/FixJ family response regulator